MRLAHSAPYLQKIPRLLLPQIAFDLAPHFLDWIQIRAVGRQVFHLDAFPRVQLLIEATLVDSRVVHDYNVAAFNIGQKSFLHELLEHRLVDRAVNQKAAVAPVVFEEGKHGGRLP